MVCRSTFKNVRHQLLHQISDPSSPESAAYREQESLFSVHSPSTSSGSVWVLEAHHCLSLLLTAYRAIDNSLNFIKSF